MNILLFTKTLSSPKPSNRYIHNYDVETASQRKYLIITAAFVEPTHSIINRNPCIEVRSIWQMVQLLPWKGID